MANVKQYRYSEIFGRTIQGEGTYTGVITSWIRFFGCNLECKGFGQEDPKDPSTYDLPHEKLDLNDVTDVNELPVVEKGCDSSYSWSKRFRHLAKRATAEQICDEVEKVNASEFNPEGKFKHPNTGQHIHLCFTGGEPILAQHGIHAVLEEFDRRGNTPHYITMETNGTQYLKEPLYNFLRDQWAGTESFWSLSPKLFTTSGEANVIKPEIVSRYTEADPYRTPANGHLKFVVNGSQETWDELDEAVQAFRDQGINWDVWIMPVGSTDEDLRVNQANICEQCFDRGYYFAPRVHAWVFDNVLGK